MDMDGPGPSFHALFSRTAILNLRHLLLCHAFSDLDIWVFFFFFFLLFSFLTRISSPLFFQQLGQSSSWKFRLESEKSYDGSSRKVKQR